MDEDIKMFFELNKQHNKNFTNQYLLSNGLILNTDSGWQEFNKETTRIIFKGYVEGMEITELIDQIITDPTPRYHGNFVAVMDLGNRLFITHDYQRATPLLVVDNSTITNMPVVQGSKIWADCYLEITDHDIVAHYFNPYGEIQLSNLSRDHVVTALYNLIDYKVKDFVNRNQLPLAVFLSGGVDTLLLFSFVKKHTNNFKFLDCFHTDLTRFYCLNNDAIIKNYWGYDQIHLYKDPTMLVSGAWGDENMLRGPTTVNILLMHHGINIDDILKPHHYHYDYFNTDKHQQIYADQSHDEFILGIVKDRESTVKHLLNINANDHQHWHFDSTLTYTPLKDLEIFKLFLQLPVEDQISQMVDSSITKQLIGMNDPELLTSLNQKNRDNFYHAWPIIKKYRER